MILEIVGIHFQDLNNCFFIQKITNKIILILIFYFFIFIKKMKKSHIPNRSVQELNRRIFLQNVFIFIAIIIAIRVL